MVDVKLSNILVFAAEADAARPLKWLICLADFGSAIINNPQDHLRSAATTLLLTVFLLLVLLQVFTALAACVPRQQMQ